MNVDLKKVETDLKALGFKWKASGRGTTKNVVYELDTALKNTSRTVVWSAIASVVDKKVVSVSITRFLAQKNGVRSMTDYDEYRSERELVKRLSVIALIQAEGVL